MSCRGSDRTGLFFCRSGLVHSCQHLSCGLPYSGRVILPVPQKEGLSFPLQVNDFSKALGRQILCTGGLDVRQRCYQPYQPIPAHGRTGVRVACWWTTRRTGGAGSQMNLTWTHCSFSNFDTNYFYKFFQVSWNDTKTCTNGGVCHYRVGKLLLDRGGIFSRGRPGYVRRFLCIYKAWTTTCFQHRMWA